MDAHIELWHNNQLLDQAKSYTAMRTVGIQRDRFMLNGRSHPRTRTKSPNSVRAAF
ncbi:hypothetical protein [Nostoc sp.]